MKAANDNMGALPFGIAPMGFNREQAAEYIGIGTTLLDRLVADGIMPKPVRLAGRVVYNRRKIEIAFNALSEGEKISSENSWDDAMNG